MCLCVYVVKKSKRSATVIARHDAICTFALDDNKINFTFPHNYSKVRYQLSPLKSRLG
jgi:hypothetical protein